ncbi:uncharacterized protein BKCO1_8100036 [Diplodia corticola]|uniref:H-type lectin domain-containing protein n=1 Tax=Diplodia corticola TaxID=236234 RepID=A0A1J9RLL9_9PEZI|nr:uncharacterized protein BKCO1_8100036 [Diplodia corticola]OJD29407.1 hypothetical protein BKCO1_8100036 [Diplodia corticola]
MEPTQGCTERHEWWREVITEMNISAAAPIIRQSRNGSGAGLPIDTRHFHEADLNYYLSIRVVTRQDRPAATFASTQALANGHSHNNFGDCFISGFLEGGQLDALISVRLKDKKRISEVSDCLSASFEISSGKFKPLTGTIDTAMRTAMELSQITVEASNVGGGTITLDDQQSSLQSLRDEASNFPTLAADQPERIFATLTKYDSLSGSQALRPALNYDHTAFYANVLLDAFIEFKNIERRLSTQTTQIKSGVMQFLKDEPLSADRKRRFDASWKGIAKAKRECTNQLLKILKEVDEIRKNPAIATDDTRDDQVEDPLVFSEYLPRVVPTAEAAPEDYPHDTRAKLYSGIEEDLSQNERAKVKELSVEHPDIAKQFRMAVPCGAVDSAGHPFCSLDYLKPDWALTETTVHMRGGVVSALSLRYANGVVTVFGTLSLSDKIFKLKLNLGTNEHIVGCSIETGRPGPEVAICITAVRLSTNRGSTLVAQPAGWKEPTNGKSRRDGVEFESLKMAHYDPLMESGYIQGFWGLASLDPTSGRGIYRLAPIWSNAAAPTTVNITNMGDTVGTEAESEAPPGGVWDMYKIHDASTPVPRTSAILSYNNTCPDRPLPVILTGFQKMDTWNCANMHFSTSVDCMTNDKFSIGVDQWSDSVLYDAEVTWIGVRPDCPGIQGGQIEAHGSISREIKFSKSFPKSPKILIWISGLDLPISNGKRVDVSATEIKQDVFRINVGSTSSALTQASISWIAMSPDSACAMGSYAYSRDSKEQDHGKEGWCSFPKGKFSKPPKLLVGFSSFDISGSSRNYYFGTSIWDVTKEAFSWKIYALDGSAISAATVQWIAIPT